MKRLHYAIALARPYNGFIARAFILNGWIAQPDYDHVRTLVGGR